MPEHAFHRATAAHELQQLLLASSDALGLDEVQDGHHNGPCLTCMRTSATVIIIDLATDEGWGARCDISPLNPALTAQA